MGYEEEDEAPMPVAAAAEVLGFGEEDPAVAAKAPPPSFLVLRSSGSRAMLVVDDVLEEAEVALKEAPLYLRQRRRRLLHVSEGFTRWGARRGPRRGARRLGRLDQTSLF